MQLLSTWATQSRSADIILKHSFMSQLNVIRNQFGSSFSSNIMNGNESSLHPFWHCLSSGLHLSSGQCNSLFVSFSVPLWFILHITVTLLKWFCYLVTKTHFSNPLCLLFNHLSINTRPFIAWFLIPPDSSLFLHLSLHLLTETGLQDSFLCGSIWFYN